MMETWKDIPGYEGRYAVSDCGKVKSLARRVRIGKYHRNINELILKPKPLHYPQVEIGGKIYLIHRLVALTFIPNPRKCRTVNHKDSDRQNNTVENLEWCTQSENNFHAVRNGRPIMRGDTHYRRTRHYNRETKRWEAAA